jgi:dipeptidyl aminopeptidase/acylaminoacyl peptidase
VNVISAEGGQIRPVVHHPGFDSNPSFSRDGKWIYFSSNRDGTFNIFRMPAGGGEPVRMTENGGLVAFESVDGKAIYYTKTNEGCGGKLFVRSVEGGPEREVLASVCPRAFAVTQQGIYYTTGPAEDRSLTVHLLDPATGKSRAMRRAAGPLYGVPFYLTVSPNGGTILLSGSAQTGSDLFLVENFR